MPIQPDHVPDFGPRTERPYRFGQGFGASFSWGLRLLAGRKLTLAAVALVAALVGFLVGTQGTARRITGPEYENYAAYDLYKGLDEGLLRFAVPLVALTLIAGGFQREIQDRTLVYHLARPISRGTLYLSRFASGLVVAIPVGLIPLWAAMASSGLELPASMYLTAPLTVSLGMLATGALYYLLAAWLRFGIIAGLVYTFVVDALLQYTAGSMQKLSAQFYLRSIHHGLTDGPLSELSSTVKRAVEKPHGLAERITAVIAERGARPGAEAALLEADRIAWVPIGEASLWLLGATAVFLTLGVVAVARRDYPLKN